MKLQGNKLSSQAKAQRAGRVKAKLSGASCVSVRIVRPQLAPKLCLSLQSQFPPLLAC